MTPPLDLAEAQQRLLDRAEPLQVERIAVAAALGRYLGEDLTAARTQPAADLSAMDGYAMPEGDSAGPWRVVGKSAAGHPFADTLGPGEAVRISTGAIMPAGAGAVLLQEHAARGGDQVALNGAGEPSSRPIRRAGFDFRSGDTLIPTGSRVGPAQIALAIMGGHGEVAVHALPSVMVIDSGDELAADPSSCAEHQIPASNGAMLAAMAAPLAASVRRIGPVADKLDALLAALGDAADADVIVTSGGVSVGDHDLIRPALEAWGATIDFWRVPMKPGKPILVARRAGQWILGLPGNPVSSYVTAFLFLLPLLRRLAGARECLPTPLKLRLAEPLPAGGERLELIRARYVDGRVGPATSQDSSALNALAASNALIVREIDAAAAERGDEVAAYLLENGGVA